MILTALNRKINNYINLNKINNMQNMYYDKTIKKSE